MIIVTVILAILLVVMFIYILRNQNQTPPPDNSAVMLKQDIDQMNNTITQLKDGLTDKLTERLDKNQQMMLGSMQKQFSESSKIITEVTKNLTELKEANKQVMGVTDELKVLQNVLSNPKKRGVLGEYQLNQLLENVLPPNRFKNQYRFKNGEAVDAVIFLENDKILSVDSKFSLENYNRMLEAKDADKKAHYMKLFTNDMKNRIDETSKYIRPAEDTMDFAFMFIPSESIYYDLLKGQVAAQNSASARDLIEYAFRDKNVIIVSPTSFMAYLQTVMQGLRGFQIEQQAKEIQKRVGELGRHLNTYEVFMQKLGNSLGTTVGHFNNAHKELKKVDKDVVKIADTSPGIEPLLLNRPQDD